MTRIAIVGGTGAQGLGLALRYTASGESVVIGSRVGERAEAAAARIRAAVPAADVTGRPNAEAITRADCIVLSVPFAGLGELLGALGPGLAGKLVIDVVVPLARHGDLFGLVPVAGAGSAGELIQQRVPAARVVSAFKTLPAARLQDLGTPLAGDVILCGDDAEARAAVTALVGRLPGLRAVDAGPLANTRFVEAITALLLNLNHRHHALTSIAILGLP